MSAFDNLGSDTQAEIIMLAKEIGAFKAAAKYAPTIGMDRVGLGRKLTKILEDEIPQDDKPLAGEKKSTLTKEEKIFLKNLQKGNVTLEEASKFVAYHVFKKMLENPGDVKFVDFFRTELLKIKQTEVQDRNNWAQEMINRMFAGKLPPRFCPHCGKPVIVEDKPKSIEGEILGEPVRLTGDL